MENIDTLTQVKEIIATLNLESTTTLQIIHDVTPLLWWRLVWFPLINEVILSVVIAFVVYTVLKFMDKHA